MKAGKYKTFKLKHGDSIREFSDIEVRHPSHPSKRAKDGTVLEMEEIKDRWELEGTELKVEATFKGRTRIEKVPVVVGFLPENVLE